jgi:hypothetical protein
MDGSDILIHNKESDVHDDIILAATATYSPTVLVHDGLLISIIDITVRHTKC